MSSTPGLLADIVAASCVDGPGNRYVVFLQGCSFNCLACHNPNTIPRRQVATTHWIDVEEILCGLRDALPFVSGITVSGGEATCQWPFVQELFQAVKSDPALCPLTTFVDSNGDVAPAVWDALAPWMDAAMLDLKALDPDVHEYLTGRSNRRVLSSIEQLAAMGKLYEVRLLIVPGVNDSEDQLLRTARWLTAVDPAVQVKVLGFRRHGTRPVAAVFAEATTEDVARAVATLRQGGIRPAQHVA